MFNLDGPGGAGRGGVSGDSALASERIGRLLPTCGMLGSCADGCAPGVALSALTRGGVRGSPPGEDSPCSRAAAAAAAAALAGGKPMAAAAAAAMAAACAATPYCGIPIWSTPAGGTGSGAGSGGMEKGDEKLCWQSLGARSLKALSLSSETAGMPGTDPAPIPLVRTASKNSMETCSKWSVMTFNAHCMSSCSFTKTSWRFCKSFKIRSAC
mmetsp:Transcript_60990/g.108417  ORF Transcript_60990/g.108417 Transcript_60990/m.108417 type:complete len:212 (+) Transcript_60990:213-848(+)